MKTFKKALAVFLCVVMTLTAAPLGSFVGLGLPELKLFNIKAEAAAEYTNGYYTYTVDKIGNATITDVDTSISGVVTIPSTFGSHPVKSIGSFAFDYCYNIITLTIPDGVTSIGSGAFYNCAFDCITIPNSVTSIDSGAFNSFYLSNIITYYTGTPEEWSQISIDSNNEYLTWNLVFESNSAEPYYGSGTCGENLTWKLYSYGEFEISGTGTMTNYNFDTPWFSIRSKIKYVTIAEGVTNIGSCAFEGCENLISVAIPDSVTDIGSCSFKDCTALPIILIPDNVTRIGYYAFENCTDFVNMYIPANVTKIENSAFNGCTNLTDVYYTGDVAGWCGIFFGNSYSNPIYYADNLYINDTLVSAELDIPAGVTRIGNYAFECYDSLKNIKIPDSVTSIGDCVFYDCNNLTDVYYTSTEEEWNKISIGSGNECLANAGFHFIEPAPEILYSGECGENLTWTLDENDLLSITGTGTMYDWANYTKVPWYSYRNQIRTVDMGDGVTSIGNYAFYGCYSLSSVTIPDSVTSIGNGAFSDCTILANISIPDSVISIGDYAFSSCLGLASITIPNSVTSIGEFAFFYCRCLINITIPDNVTSIGDGAFNWCDSLASVTIPDSINNICNNLFENCSNLTSITIPDSVTSIGDYAFSKCTSLATVTIGNSVTNIGEAAFYDCNNLTDVYYNSTEEEWKKITTGLVNECLTDAEIHFVEPTPEILYSGKCGDNLTWTLDEKGLLLITGTGDMDNWLTESTMPWYSCRNQISTVDISNGVTSIGSYAFYDCYSLSNVTIPDSVTTIGIRAFASCDSLTGVTVPDGVTTIGAYAFAWSSNLTSITIGNGATSIGDNAFYYCESLTSVTIGNGITNIGNAAFANCVNLTSITIPDSVIIIGYSAFIDCDSLTSVTIGNGVASIGVSAFYNCDSLTSVTIPNSVTSIGDDTFGWCNSLTSINVDADNEYYSCDSCGVLFNKDKSELIQYPKGNTRNSYVIPDSVTSISAYAFLGCNNLASVTIPDSVASIGYEAFLWCNKLTDVYYAGSEEEWSKLGYSNWGALVPTIHFNYHDHIPGEWITTKKPDCVSEGTKIKKCTICGETVETGVVSSIGHSHESKVTKEPTCTNTGIRTFNCHCGDSYTEVIKANGHTKGEWEYIGGKEYAKSCTVCGDKLESKIITVSLFFNGENVSKKQVLNKSTATVTATVTDNFVNDLVFASSDNSTVSVDANGNVIANNIGKATITVTIKGTAISDSIEVEVLPRDFTVTWNVNGKQTKQTVKEEAKFTPNVNTTLKGYKFIGWDKTVPTTMPAENLTFTAQFELIVKQLKIKNPSTSTINFGETLVMHADFGGVELPEGWKIQWTVEGAGFDMAPAADGLTCKMASVANGTATVKATIVDENGEAVLDADSNEMSDSKQLTSKAGFWQKFVSFFKNLFGISRVILQSI